METIKNRRIGREGQNAEIEALSQPKYSRRNLLKRAAVAGAAGLGLLSMAACGGKQAQPDEQAKPPASIGEQTACVTSGAPGTDAGARKALKYVDQSSDPARVCNGCRFFKQPEGGAVCGGCQIITGPIAPTGSCSTWTARS